MRIASGVVDQVVFFEAWDVNNPTQRLSGLSGFTVYYAKDTGAPTQIVSPDISELSSTNMKGVYSLGLTAGTTLSVGNETEMVGYNITQASMKPVLIQVEIFSLASLASIQSDTSNIYINTQDILSALDSATDFATEMDAHGYTALRAANLDNADVATSTIPGSVLSTNVATVEGSAPHHSLCTVVLACLEWSISGSTWTIKRTDGSTTHATKTITPVVNPDGVSSVN